MRQIGPCTLEIPHHFSIFYSLARSIAYQQLAGAAAQAIFGRVEALFPKGRMTPKRLLELDDAVLRAAGLSQNKLAALRDLAAKCLDGTVPTKRKLAAMADEEIIERISQVRGIGRWTVEMLLIFRLGRPNVLPVDDYGVRKGMQRLYQLARVAQQGGHAPPRPQVGAVVLGGQLVPVALRGASPGRKSGSKKAAITGRSYFRSCRLLQSNVEASLAMLIRLELQRLHLVVLTDVDIYGFLENLGQANDLHLSGGAGVGLQVQFFGAHKAIADASGNLGAEDRFGVGSGHRDQCRAGALIGRYLRGCNRCRRALGKLRPRTQDNQTE